MAQANALNSPLGASGIQQAGSTHTVTDQQSGSDILDAEAERITLDKSNILLLGPTGSGNLLMDFY